MSLLRLSVLFLLTTAFPLAAQGPPTATATTTGRTSRSGIKLLPGTQNTVLSTIQGNALTSTNGPLTDAPVRLRDARTGRIIDVQVTDKAGLFVFRGVEPGSYIVEVMSDDNTIVLTASQILSVDAGDAVSAVVKLPFRIPPFAGVLGGNSASSLAAIAAQAATSGITAVSSIGDPTCSLQ